MAITRCDNCGSRVTVNKLEKIVLCETCDELFFQKIKEYIDKNKSASISELHRQLKIPIQVINKYVEDDRLFAPEDQERLKQEKEIIDNKEKKLQRNRETLKLLLESMDEDRKPTKTSSDSKMRFIDNNKKIR